mmetsp:Transcript_12526/g.30597  ORF Transcript_12526/g.30597 Transcript_12526/m.30597 type:complete len:82 (+) Transcript_12526:97-342(+)
MPSSVGAAIVTSACGLTIRHRRRGLCRWLDEVDPDDGDDSSDNCFFESIISISGQRKLKARKNASSDTTNDRGWRWTNYFL